MRSSALGQVHGNVNRVMSVIGSFTFSSLGERNYFVWLATEKDI